MFHRQVNENFFLLKFGQFQLKRGVTWEFLIPFLSTSFFLAFAKATGVFSRSLLA